MEIFILEAQLAGIWTAADVYSDQRDALRAMHYRYDALPLRVIKVRDYVVVEEKPRATEPPTMA